jgi:hypothetical protein
VLTQLPQAFFAYRVQVLSGKWWLAAPAYVGQAFRAGSGIAVFILTLHDKELPIFQSRHGFVVDMSLTASAVVCACVRRNPVNADTRAD